MAMLIPILLPHIIAAGANIGLGVVNAIQGDSSAVSLQIGKKVFTSRKSCNLSTLQPELRYRIILMALEESKSLILDIPPFVDPADILSRDARQVEHQNPFNPKSDHYGSIKGDLLEANGYPLSSWKWQRVCREWRAILEKPLWEHLEVKGIRKYSRLLHALEKGKEMPELGRVKRIILREGFSSTQELYTILCSPAFTQLEEISILPDWPTSFYQLLPSAPCFTFGINVLRTAKPTKALTYGLPLEATTNKASREHLGTLKPPHLTMTVVQPTVSLFSELKDLVAESTKLLTVRYVPLKGVVDAQMFLCAPLQEFQRVEVMVFVPRQRRVLVGPVGNRTVVDDPDWPGARFVANLLNELELAREDVQLRYTVIQVDDWELPGTAHRATRTQIWPKEIPAEFGDAEEAALGAMVERSGFVRSKSGEQSRSRRRSSHWDRETNLKLLGGLINLRLESQKRSD